jgi:hypothetical protein
METALLGRDSKRRKLRQRMQHEPAVWSTDKERQRLPVSGDAKRPLPNARRDVPGRPEG